MEEWFSTGSCRENKNTNAKEVLTFIAINDLCENVTNSE